MDEHQFLPDDIVELPKLQCYCHHHCPPSSNDGICSVPWGGRCFAAVEEVYNPLTGHLEPEYSYGCFSSGDPAFLQCKGHLVQHEIPTSILCCDGGNFCNEHLKPLYTPTNLTDLINHGGPGNGGGPGGTANMDYYLLQILLGVVLSFLVLVFLIILFIVCKYRSREKKSLSTTKIKKKKKGSNSSSGSGSCEENLVCLGTTLTKPGHFSGGSGSTSLMSSTKFGGECIDMSSGSGSGLPLLVQRTIGRQINLKSRIGKGRYGEVYLAEWGGTCVAVKSFYSIEDASWEREKQIYQLALMKHPNILVSMAWDIRSVDSVTQMIMVMDYHPHGSLYDYLETRTLDEDEAFKVILSIVSGLCHLHIEIDGKPGKPGVAHRDLKSKNILIKSNGEACLADFGLAVCSVQDTKTVDRIPNNIKSGTKRYMSPEILDESINPKYFESYKQSDMYSFALILWEIGTRTLTPGTTPDSKPEYNDYSVPYATHTSVDPSFDEMKNIVVSHNLRPAIPARWSGSPVLCTVEKIIKECWDRNPAVRLSSLYVKKKFVELRNLLESPTKQSMMMIPPPPYKPMLNSISNCTANSSVSEDLIRLSYGSTSGGSSGGPHLFLNVD